MIIQQSKFLLSWETVHHWIIPFYWLKGFHFPSRLVRRICASFAGAPTGLWVVQVTHLSWGPDIKHQLITNTLHTVTCICMYAYMQYTMSMYHSWEYTLYRLCTRLYIHAVPSMLFHGGVFFTSHTPVSRFTH